MLGLARHLQIRRKQPCISKVWLSVRGFAQQAPSVVEIDYKCLQGMSPEALKTLRKAFVGERSYGAVAVTGIPDYGKLRDRAFRAGIDLALKDAKGRAKAAAVSNTYPGWSGTPGSETHPLQSSFLFNTKEELNGKPDPYFGKNIFPSEQYRQKWVDLVKPMHSAALLVLDGLDRIMEETGRKHGYSWAAQGRSLHRLGEDGPALASRFICYDSAFTREDRIFDDQQDVSLKGSSNADDLASMHTHATQIRTTDHVGHAADGLASMRTHATPIKSTGAGHSADGLASMRTHSTPVKSSGAGHAADGLASMRTHSTPVKSSGAGHAADGLASMRTHSTPVKSSGAGHAADGLASMRTHSTPVKSSGAGHAADGLASMRTHSTPVKSSGAGHAADGLASMRTHSTPVKSSGAGHAADGLASMRTHSTPIKSSGVAVSGRSFATLHHTEQGQTPGNDAQSRSIPTVEEEKGEYWLPWHIDSNFVTLIHKEMYAYENDGSIVSEPQGAGVIFMNKLGETTALETSDSALVIQFGGFGQIYTGGEITACRHAVLSPKPNGIARFNFCNFWYAKWDTLCDAPPGMESTAINTGWNAMMDDSYLNISMKNGFAAFRKFMTSPEARVQFANSKHFHELAEAVPLPDRSGLQRLQPVSQRGLAASPQIVVDLLTDVRCPFSYLAKLNLDIAISNRGLQDKIVFRYHPVFLNPYVPKEGENLDEYLFREYGITKEYAHSQDYPLFKAAQQVGVNLNPNRRVINTFDAFCLLDVAEQEGLQTQVLEEMSRRYFEKAQDLSCENVLRDVAETVGLHVKDRLLSVEVAAGVAAKYQNLRHLVAEVPHFILRDVASGNGVEINGTRSVGDWGSILEQVLLKGNFVGMTIPGKNNIDLVLPRANPTSPVSLAFSAQHGWHPNSWPYTDLDFVRADETDDSEMYSLPRFVNHLDGESIDALREVYAAAFSCAKDGFSVLDLCSSWTSHFPEDLMENACVVAHGMNQAELRRNKHASEIHLQDLNMDPLFPWDNNTFDFVTLAMSVQYLTKPRLVFSEIHRVLKPGGMAIVAYSNRCFIDKTVNIWANEVYDGEGHAHILRNYYTHSVPNGWTGLASIDVSPKIGDPVWMVTAVKSEPS